MEASLTQLLGSKPISIWDNRMTDHGWDGEVIGYQITIPSEAQRASAIEELLRALKPMAQRECVGLLGELKLLTKCRPEQQRDLEAQLGLYTRKILEYPADVARHVLITQANIEIFWPSWSELKERLDLHTRRRRRMLDALEKTSVQKLKKTTPAPTNSSSPPVVAPRRRIAGPDLESMTDADIEAARIRVLAQCEEAERSRS